MAGTPTPRLLLPLPAETDPADVPLDLSKLASALDSGGSGSVPGGVAYDNQGTFSARPAAATRGRYYFATDANTLYRDTGSAWVQVAPQSIGGGVLPTSPVDGQEIFMSNWHLRYSAGSASTYKWQFYGGTPTAASFLTAQNASVGAWAAGQPGLSLSNPGDYLFTFSASATLSAAGLIGLAVAFNGSPLLDTQTALQCAAGEQFLGRADVLMPNIAAGAYAVAFYTTSVGTSFARSYLSIQPQRIG